MLAVVRAALHAKFLLLFGSALAYSAAVIYVAAELGQRLTLRVRSRQIE
jgi:hypothetical protein